MVLMSYLSYMLAEVMEIMESMYHSYLIVYMRIEYYDILPCKMLFLKYIHLITSLQTNWDVLVLTAFRPQWDSDSVLFWDFHVSLCMA